MARTIIGVNDPKAVKRWSGALALDMSQKSYFNQRFMGRGPTAQTPIQILTDLDSDAGESISYDLLAELKMAPVEGEDILEGKEEQQRFYTDVVFIDQARCGVNTGGAMTRKRTLHDLRARAKMQQSSWWARLMDEICFIYLSGARGINPNYILPLGYTGRADNALTAPDQYHQLYGGTGTAFNNIDPAADLMDLRIIDRAKSKADSQGGGATNVPVLQPVMFNGNETFVLVMHTWQEDALRGGTAAGQYLDIQKAAAAAQGANNPIFKNALGMYRGVVLHSHRNVVTFNNAGAAGNVNAARALFMGAQAAVMAFGSPGNNLRFDWHEETRDNGDKVVITTSSIFGVKKTTFDTPAGALDFGVFSLDTAVTPS
jgi:N4-gp56 family major capsid protein